MHQHAASSHAYRDGVQNVFEFLRRDRSCVRDWNLDVDDFRCSRNLLAAKRNDGRDTPRIGTRQLHRIFHTPEIESFPNVCHLSPGLVDRCMPLVLPMYPCSNAGTERSDAKTGRYLPALTASLSETEYYDSWMRNVGVCIVDDQLRMETASGNEHTQPEIERQRRSPEV